MSKTVLVVGAGASAEAGLPIGSDLTGLISKSLTMGYQRGSGDMYGDPFLISTLKLHAQSQGLDFDVLMRACERICKAMWQAPSIDTFIDQNNTDSTIAFCAKLAIVYSILAAESKSPMHVEWLATPGQLQYFENAELLASTWYKNLWQLLTGNRPAAELRDRFQSVAMIVFNYDRCIEHYLYNSLRWYYGIEEEASDLLRHLEIYHPYGVVDQSASFGFQEMEGEQQLLNLVSGIKTFAEGTDPDGSDIAAIRRLMREAGTLVFLGFAFHKQNLRLLWPEPVTCPEDSPITLGTCYRTSHDNRKLISADLSRLSGRQVDQIWLRSDCTCARLFAEYSRRLEL